MFKYLKKLVIGATIDREDIANTYVSVSKVIEDTVIPSIEMLKDEDLYKDASSEFNKLVDNMGATLNTRKDIMSVLSAIEELFVEISESKDDVLDLIGALGEFISDRSKTPKEVGVIGIVNTVTEVTLYVQDLLLYIPYVVKGDDFFTKAKVNDILENSRGLITTMSMYKGQFKDKVSEVRELSDVTIREPEDVVVNGSKNDNEFTLPVTNFIGNPIYHIRLWLLEIDMIRIENLERKKQLLALKIANLKAKGSTIGTAKSIEKLEEMIQKYEARIRKLEKRR